MKSIDIVIPSFRSRELVSLAIKSFEKHRNGYNFRYIVVENSNDVSYMEDVLSLSEDVVWVQNPISSFLDSNSPTVRSDANASGIEKGLELVTTEYVFLCHNDVAACHDEWMDYLVSKLDVNTPLVGVNTHDGVAHIIGVLVRTDIAKSVSMYPELDVKDCGDDITHYCVENNLNYFICQNTFNDSSLVEKIELEEYRNLNSVTRILNDDYEVIYMHLARGADKAHNYYNKPNRMLLPDWIKFVNNVILSES